MRLPTARPRYFARRILLSFGAIPLGAALLAGSAATQAQAPAAGVKDPAKTLHGFDPALLDTTANPCEDFYQYSCGGWTRANPIPNDRANWGRDTELSEQNDLVLRDILEKAAASRPDRTVSRTPDEQKIGDEYAACSDVAAINAKGMAPLLAQLAPIDALGDKKGLAVLLAQMQVHGNAALFDYGSEQDFHDAAQQIAYVSQPQLGLPEKGFYSRTDATSAALRESYQQHIERVFVLAGESQAQAANDAAAALRLETAMAAGSLSLVEMRDPAKLYHPTPLAQFAPSSPISRFPEYLRTVGSPAVNSLNVAEPVYFRSLNDLLKTASLDDIKAYLRWTTLRRAPATAVPAALDAEDFAFYGKALRGQPQQLPRWKRCVARVDGDLGEALGRVFVAQRFTPKDKERTLTLARDVEAAMGRDIDSLTWMSPATKAEAKVKLRAVTNKIGYPDTWRDYSSLLIVRDDALGNAMRAAVFNEKRDLAKIGKPVDRGEWQMSPPTVNAYYSPQLNDVNFPAGILQPPYFDGTQDDAVNYGDAGGVVGHELTHGFDDEGRQFDAQGNFRNWWTVQDAKEFTERAACVVNEYDKFVAVDDVHVNGRLTLGENLADLGGLRLSYLAYLDRAARTQTDINAPGTAEYGGLSPAQQFFASYGQGWCESHRPEALRTQVQSDPHAPENYRVNGVVQNLPEFQKAFHCRTGEAMAPATRCSVW